MKIYRIMPAGLALENDLGRQRFTGLDDLDSMADWQTLYATHPATVDQMTLGPAHLDIHFTNQSNNPGVLVLWVIRPRHNLDSTETADTIWANSITNVGGTTTRLYQTPFEQTEFCQRFKVIRKCEFRLGPGGTGKFVVSRKKPITLKRWKVDSDFSQSKHSQIVMAQIYGHPTNDSVNKTTEFTTTQMKVVFVKQKVYKHLVVGDNNSAMAENIGLAQSLTNAAHIMEDAAVAADVHADA